MRRLLGILGAALAGMATSSAAQLSQAAPPGRVIERVVALVGGHVITLSELEFEARVALIQRGGIEAATAPLDDRALRAALELSIAERLETDAAEKLQIFAVEESEVDSALRAFKAKLQSPGELAAFLARHEVDEQQLAAVVARRLRAEKIVDSKVGLRARVTDAEMRRFYEAHRSELGASYEEARSAIRTKLLRERYAALAREEMDQIRKGADVRMIAPFAREAPREPR